MNKYVRIYQSIIERAISRGWGCKKYKQFKHLPIPNEYTETHHIVPRCMGGTNNKNNLVVLSLKEHYIAHMLLTKIYPDNDKILLAFIIMKNKTKGKNAKGFEFYRKRHSEAMKNINPKLKPETIEKIRNSISKLVKDESYIKRVSDGVKRAYEDGNLRKIISEKSKKMWESEEFRELHRNAMKKVTSSQEFRKKVGETIKRQNKENPELYRKRLKAIEKHQKYKSEEWKKKCSVWFKDYMNRPEVKDKLRLKRSGINSVCGRKVYCFKLDCVFFTAKFASQELGINLSTLKKWMNKKIDKYCCVWYDDYLKGDYTLCK